MRTKFYRISNKQDLTLGVVKSTSYDAAFTLFAQKKPQFGGVQVYSEILTPDELFDLLRRQLPTNCVIA